MKILPLFWIFLFPSFLCTQTVDTAAVVREVDSLIQVSRALTGKRDFEQALAVNAVAEKLTLEKLGRETAAYGSCCLSRGRVLYFRGDYLDAEKWYLESKDIREKVLGREHPNYATSLNYLATLYSEIENYEKAEHLFIEAKIILEKSLGKEHVHYASSLENLANLFSSLENFEKAEHLYLEAKAIREKVLGKEHPDYARSLSNLANMYNHIGNYEKSESFYLEAKSIREKVLGKEHPDYARSLNNLANLYNDLGNYEKAEPLHLEAKDIREKALGKEHPAYARSIGNLADVYFKMGNYKKSEFLILEAKDILEKTLGKENSDYALILNNLAVMYSELSNYEKAEPLHLEAKAIYERALGKDHPDYALNLSNLADLYWNMGDILKANLQFSELANLNQSFLTRASHHLSECELNNYLNTFSSIQNQMLSFAQVTSDKNFQTPRVCYSNILFYKGFLLQATNQVKHLALSDSSSTEKFNLLKSYQRRLATEYTNPIADRDSTNVADLEGKANSLEKDLARTVAGYSDAMRQVKWQEVQVTLKSGEVAVEFVHYRYYTPKATDSTMYAALVLRPDDAEPQFVPLFEEKEIVPLLRGAAGGNNFLKINALYANKSAGNKQKSLYELIWQPLENQLQGIKTVYCSPSGLLHRLNLAAIPTMEGKPFGDGRQIVLLGSTRSLVVPNTGGQNATSTAYLAGGIRYDSDSTAIAAANRNTASGRGLELPGDAPRFYPDSVSGTRSGVLDYLPATAAEVREIGQILSSVNITARIDTGFYATEEAFRQLGTGGLSPRIVHLATHGYFFPDPKPVGSKHWAVGNEREPVFKMSEHPMIRSGLIMAGAKQAWLTGKHPEGQEDGILTAYEISQMNLSGTELVVLSACETGLGDIVGNEGVYGLQRAFKIAGVKYLIMSLWKVDDRSTREFMAIFYRHWLRDKQPIPQAFRTAQQEMRAKYTGAYDWAGFVLVE